MNEEVAGKIDILATIPEATASYVDGPDPEEEETNPGIRIGNPIRIIDERTVETYTMNPKENLY